MDKITDLLKKIGASDELAEGIVIAINEHIETQRTALQEELQTKLNKAKSVCLEEVETYKKDLARRVEVFCESKSAKIERAKRKQLANEESEATSKLKEAKAILEGIDINVAPGNVSKDLVAERDKNAKLEQRLQALTEQNQSLSKRNKEVNQVASRVLGKNKLLESKLKNAGVILEDSSKPVTESEEGSKPKLKAKIPFDPNKRVVAEEASRRRPKQPIVETKEKGFTVDAIAESMD